MAYQETSLRISATVKKSGSKPTMQMQIIRFIIAVLGCYGSTFIFLTGYDLDVSKGLVFAVIIGCCFLTGAYSLKKSIAYLTFAFTSVSCILASFMLKEEYSAGLAVVINKYKSLTDPDYKKTPYIALLEPELADRDMTIFIVLTAIFLCLAVGMLFNYSNSGFYTAILLTVVTLPVFIIGLEPSSIAFAAFVISVTSLTVFEFTASNSVTGQQFFRYGIQCAAATLLIASVCICIVFGFMKITDYERSDKINELFHKADNYIDSGEFHNDVMTKLYLGNDYTFYGAINHGKLDSFGDIRFKFIDVLQVTMPRSADTVYLRGFVGSVYTGRSWEELPDGKLRKLEKITDSFNTDGLSPLLFDSYNLKNAPTILPNYSFTVKNIAANDDYMYLPYNLVPESISRYTIVDHSYFKGDSSTYFGQVYNPDSYHGYQNLFRKRWSIPSVLVADEATYRNFVYENYLELPESFSPEEMFNQNYYEYITAEEIQTGKSTLDEMTVFSRKLYYIKEWLRDNCTYSLTTEPLARGDDFVNHFLEHKEGSCSHFASTAVLMCRYAGIPARYVEGYIITPYDIEFDAPMGSTVTVNVKDSHGHAWAEVYIDGYGWYPMEFTSGYGNVRTAFPTETTVTETETVTESEPEADETTVVQNEDGTDATTD
ncbi:MAG: transglutaminase domain-containing protein, partial [Oscillospiraceae bacterium]|nr:transglutaminase domain-containing protein [Oscillospiraceae bacterium]